MIETGVQTHNIVMDEDPLKRFLLMKEAGFSCADFSLNFYLKNTDLYKHERNTLFDQSIRELEDFFRPHKKAA